MDTRETSSYAQSCASPDSNADVLTPRTPERDCIWRQVFKEGVK